jgi:hypothetical protein
MYLKVIKNNLIEWKKNYKRYYFFGDHDVALELNNEFKDKTSIVILSKIINEDFAYVNFINSMLSLELKSPLYQVREKRISLLYSLLSIKNEWQGNNYYFNTNI